MDFKFNFSEINKKNLDSFPKTNSWYETIVSDVSLVTPANATDYINIEYLIMDGDYKNKKINQRVYFDKDGNPYIYSIQKLLELTNNLKNFDSFADLAKSLIGNRIQVFLGTKNYNANEYSTVTNFKSSELAKRLETELTASIGQTPTKEKNVLGNLDELSDELPF